MENSRGIPLIDGWVGSLDWDSKEFKMGRFLLMSLFSLYYNLYLTS
jgi:hypothetical protein